MSSIKPALQPTSPAGMTLKAAAAPPHSPGRDVVARLAQLTAREVDVMARLVAGQSSRAIAVDLGISSKTVAWHRGRVMTKLGCSSLFELGRAWEAAVWSNREKTATR